MANPGGGPPAPPGLPGSVLDIMPIAEDHSLGQDVINVETGLQGTADPTTALQILSGIPGILKRVLIEISKQGNTLKEYMNGFKGQLEGLLAQADSKMRDMDEQSERVKNEVVAKVKEIEDKSGALEKQVNDGLSEVQAKLLVASDSF